MNIGADLPQKGRTGMWHNKVQVCSEALSMNVFRGVSMVGSVIQSFKPVPVLGEMWVAQSRRH